MGGGGETDLVKNLVGVVVVTPCLYNESDGVLDDELGDFPGGLIQDEAEVILHAIVLGSALLLERRK